MDQFYVVQRRISVTTKKKPLPLKSTDQIQLHNFEITTETHCYIGID